MADSGYGHTPSTAVESGPGQQIAESVASTTTPDQQIAKQAKALRIKPKRYWPQYLASKYHPPSNLTFRQLCAGYPNHLAEGLLVEMHLKGLTPKDILEMLPSDVQADMNGHIWMETRMKCALARAGLGEDSSAPSSPSKSAPPSRPATPKPFTITPRKRKQKEGDMQLPNIVSPKKTTLTEPSLLPATETEASNPPGLPNESADSSDIATNHQDSQVPLSQASNVVSALIPPPKPLPDTDPFLTSCREEIRKHRAFIIDILQYKPEFIQISSQEEKANDVDLQWLTWCDRVNNRLRHSHGMEPVGTRTDGLLILRALERLVATHKVMRKKAWAHDHPHYHRIDVIAKMAYRDAKEDVLRVLHQRSLELESELYQVEAGIATWANIADTQNFNDYGGRYGPFGVPLTIGAIQHGEEMNRIVRQRLDIEAEAAILPYLDAMRSYDPQSAEPLQTAFSNRGATMQSGSTRLHQANETHTSQASNDSQYLQPAPKTKRSREPAMQSDDIPGADTTLTAHEPTGCYAPGYASWAELNAMPLDHAVSTCPTFTPQYPRGPEPDLPLATLPPRTVDPRNLSNHSAPDPSKPRAADLRTLSEYSDALRSHSRLYNPDGPTCLVCKKMRRKCDRGQPACGYCVRNRHGCAYSAEAASMLGSGAMLLWD